MLPSSAARHQLPAAAALRHGPWAWSLTEEKHQCVLKTSAYNQTFGSLKINEHILLIESIEVLKVPGPLVSCSEGVATGHGATLTLLHCNYIYITHYIIHYICVVYQ